MKQATIYKHVLILVILAVLAIAGCKSGSSWKMDNPFSRKPKAPSKETPKEIDGIQLSAPPEKYSKELSKHDSKAKGKEKSSEKTFAQKGKYETFPSSKEMKIDRTPEVAVSPKASEASSTASIPSYKSGSTSGTRVASTAVGSTIDKSSPWPSPQATASPGMTFPAAQPQGTNTPMSTPSPYAGTQQAYPGTQQAYPGTQQAYPGTQQTYPGTQQAYPGTQQAYPGTQQAYPGTQQTYPSPSATPVTGTYPAPTTTTSPGTMAPGFAPGSIGGN